MKTISFRVKRKWKHTDSALFLDQMSMYLSAGLSIDAALKIVAVNSPKSKQVSLLHMLTLVESGATFSSVFEKHMSQSGTLIGIIKQGEMTGELGKSFQLCHELIEQRDELAKKCLSALAYPIVIGIFAALLTIGLVRGVMPQIIPLLMSLHVELPLLTRVVIAVSEAFLRYGFIIIAVLLSSAAATGFFYRKYRRVRKAVQGLLLGTPLAGNMLRLYTFTLFLRSCGSLIESGTPAAVSYERAAENVDLIPLKVQLERHTRSLFQGATFAAAFSDKKLKIPAHIPALTSAGEASGTLSHSLIRGAHIIDRDIEHRLKRLTSLIEPLMMAVMGCTVGAIALSIMMPIYDISKVLQR